MLKEKLDLEKALLAKQYQNQADGQSCVFKQFAYQVTMFIFIFANLSTAFDVSKAENMNLTLILN